MAYLTNIGLPPDKQISHFRTHCTRNGQAIFLLELTPTFVTSPSSHSFITLFLLKLAMHAVSTLFQKGHRSILLYWAHQ